MKLFTGFGIELEYMIVNRNTLDVLPVTDKVLLTVAGEAVNEVERGEIAWSNELVKHVIELKTNGPAKSLDELPGLFLQNVREINKLLQPLQGMMLPSAMHPWMDPFKEIHLWEDENKEIYEAYDRIFDCRGHGWANLQSIHINLPFDNDEEFGRLHAAIRLILPIIPALAASSPIADGAPKGFKDYRLEVYRNNQKKVPSVGGKVIPEPVFSIADYHSRILQPMYRDISAYDPEGTLQEEWLNSRGAIALFDRNTIEIRLIDSQECPLADVSVAAFIIEVLQLLTSEKISPYEMQQEFDEDTLARVLLKCIEQAENTTIEDERYLVALGIDAEKINAMEIWQYFFEMLAPQKGFWLTPVSNILLNGTLATRILNACGPVVDKKHLKPVYIKLAKCIETNTLFT